MPGIASLLADEKVPAYFIFDDDKDGVDNKNKILSSFKDSFSNKSVFTIKDIENGLPPKSTLEDLYPFINSQFRWRYLGLKITKIVEDLLNNFCEYGSCHKSNWE